MFKRHQEADSEGLSDLPESPGDEGVAPGGRDSLLQL